MKYLLVLIVNIIFPSAVAIAATVITFIHRPIYMLCCLILFAVGAALLTMFFANIYFITITFIIIYVGAIMILFLFIIMMFDLRNKKSYINEVFNNNLSRPLQISIIFFIFSKIYFWIKWNIINILFNNLYFTNFSTYQYNNIKLDLQYYSKDIFIFSDLLYTRYGNLLILVSVIMLLAMFGSLSLVLKIQNKSSWKN
jgi:NADH:ubiquinone oxidoreductase subunit 6 (subunit J)